MSKDTQSELPEKRKKLLRRFETHKKRSEGFLKYLNNYFYEAGTSVSIRERNLRSQLPKLAECGSYLLFRDYYNIGQTRCVSANFCKKHTLCGLCAIRRAGKASQNVHDKVKHLMAENPNLKAYFIVLTVKNEPNLAHAYMKLRKGYKRILYTIRDAKRARKTQNPEKSKYANALNSEFANIAGGVYSIETTHNDEEKTWHPHMNLLVLSSSKMNNFSVSKEWLKKTGDSFITHCKEVDPVNDPGVVCEIMKYALKFTGLTFKTQLEAYLGLFGRRLTGTIGNFRGVQLEPNLEDESIEGEEYIEILYSYVNGGYKEVGERISSVEKSFA